MAELDQAKQLEKAREGASSLSLLADEEEDAALNKVEAAGDGTPVVDSEGQDEENPAPTAAAPEEDEEEGPRGSAAANVDDTNLATKNDPDEAAAPPPAPSPSGSSEEPAPSMDEEKAAKDADGLSKMIPVGDKNENPAGHPPENEKAAYAPPPPSSMQPTAVSAGGEAVGSSGTTDEGRGSPSTTTPSVVAIGVDNAEAWSESSSLNNGRRSLPPGAYHVVPTGVQANLQNLGSPPRNGHDSDSDDGDHPQEGHDAAANAAGDAPHPPPPASPGGSWDAASAEHHVVEATLVEDANVEAVERGTGGAGGGNRGHGGGGGDDGGTRHDVVVAKHMNDTFVCSKKKALLLGGALIAVAVVLGVSLGLTLPNNDDDGSPDNNEGVGGASPPPPPPTAAPSVSPSPTKVPTRHPTRSPSPPPTSAPTEGSYGEVCLADPQTCGCYADMGDYRGTINVTGSGKTCQPWDDQSPHEHSYFASDHPELIENYCRGPDSSGGTWCYTADPNTRWEYCDVPRCNTTLVAVTTSPTQTPALEVTPPCDKADRRTKKGLRFDGTTNYVVLPNSTSTDAQGHGVSGGLNLGPGPFTISVWVKPQKKNDFSTILSNKWGGNDKPGYIFAVNSWKADHGKLTLEGTYSKVVTTVSVAWDEWQHVAVTYDGTKPTFYIDGQNVAHDQEDFYGAFSILPGRIDAKIGDVGQYNVGNGLYAGIMDELRVYNYTRSGDEIRADMHCELGNSSSSGVEPGLIAHYRFEQGEDDRVVYDSLGIHHGQLKGGKPDDDPYVEGTSLCVDCGS